MTTRVFPLAIACFAIPAWSQQPGTVDLTGKIVDAASGAPLAGVNLVLSRYPVVADFKTADLSARTYTAKTDERGAFAIPGLIPDRYSTNATFPGYGLQRGPERSVTLSASESPAPLTIRMWKSAVVEGVVEDRDHNPIGGIAVDLLQESWSGGMRGLSPAVPAARPKDDGKFSFPAVLPGTYYLRASAAARLTGDLLRDPTLRQTAKLADTFYPHSIELEGATPIKIFAGVDQLGLRLQIQPGVYYTLSGRVDGIPEGVKSPSVRLLTLAGVDSSLQIYTGSPAGPVQAPVSSDGTFSIRNVAPGPYIATLVAASGNLRGANRVNVKDRDLEDIRIAVSSSWTLAGKVVYQDGSPAGPFLAYLDEFDPSAGVKGTVFTVPADGTFSQAGLIAGAQRFSIPDRRDLIVTKIDLGDRSFEGGKFELGAPGNDHAVITLSTKGGAINGMIEISGRGDVPVRGSASVMMTPATLVDSAPKYALLGPDGSFSIGALEPGQYRVCAWHEEGPQIGEVLGNPSFQQRLDSGCKTVRLKADGNETVQLKQLSVADFR
jgi:hypothetical protein